MSGESKPAVAVRSGGGSPIYGLGMVGALVFYWRHSDAGFQPHLRAVLKALVWPAFVVHDVVRLLDSGSTVMSPPGQGREEASA